MLASRWILAIFLTITGICRAQLNDQIGDHRRVVLNAEPPFVWPTNAEQATRSLNLDKGRILRFLQDLYPSPSWPHVDNLKQFRFEPLEADKYFLVAVVSPEQKDYFNTIATVRCEGKICDARLWQSDGENDLDQQLVDANGDGVFEIIARKNFALQDEEYLKPANIYSILGLVNHELIDVSSKHRQYFQEHILPLMAAEELAIRKQRDDEVRDERGDLDATLDDADVQPADQVAARPAKEDAEDYVTVELQFLSDDYQRRVLGNQTAGLERALRWVQSQDYDPMQGYGLYALEAMDSVKAAAAIEKLTHSPNIIYARSC